MVAGMFLAVGSRMAWALEGAPPFAWFPHGPLAADLHAVVEVRPESGFSGGFAGGDPARSLQVRSYLVAPVFLRYGLWGTLEAYGAFPFYWGSSPQQYVDRTYGLGELNATVSGADVGDPALGARWRAWRSPTEAWNVMLVTGLVIPWGFNVWQGFPRFSYVRTAPDTPELAVGDGAWKLLVGVQERYESETFMVDALVGYILKFPLRATLLELNVGEEITVNLPSPVTAWIRPAWLIGERLWVTGRVDGVWAPHGSVTAGGTLAKVPGLLDSYMNLVRASGGVWAGGGLRWELMSGSALSLEASAPVAAHRLYRYWRISASASYSWRP